jgi:hypothetical protein
VVSQPDALAIGTLQCGLQVRILCPQRCRGSIGLPFELVHGGAQGMFVLTCGRELIAQIAEFALTPAQHLRLRGQPALQILLRLTADCSLLADLFCRLLHPGGDPVLETCKLGSLFNQLLARSLKRRPRLNQCRLVFRDDALELPDLIRLGKAIVLSAAQFFMQGFDFQPQPVDAIGLSAELGPLLRVLGPERIELGLQAAGCQREFGALEIFGGDNFGCG